MDLSEVEYYENDKDQGHYAGHNKKGDAKEFVGAAQ